MNIFNYKLVANNKPLSEEVISLTPDMANTLNQSFLSRGSNKKYVLSDSNINKQFVEIKRSQIQFR